ncbi:MAG: hypothetical protein LBP38_07705 [Desulfovibrio sp.]|jgi:hypothetical protein|nr:hypothetical protein [Desulfovibrio sp.]
MSQDSSDTQARLLRARLLTDAPVYIQERTYFDIITKTLEAVNSVQPASHSASQIEKALGGKFDMSRYAGFDSKGFIIDDEG